MNLPHIEPLNMAIAMRDDETRRAIEARLRGKPRHLTVGAMPSARAFVLRTASIFVAASVPASIAIAAFCALYFVAEFLR